MSRGSLLDGCTPWSAEDAERYRREGYWRGETLVDLFDRSVASRGEATALICDGRRVTYAQLQRSSARLAAGLWELGIRPRDRVVVHLPNVPEFVVVCFTLFRLGALPVMALPAHRRSEIEHLCRSSGAIAYVIPDVLHGFEYRALAEDVRRSVSSLQHVLVAGEAAPFYSLASLETEPRQLPPPAASDVALFLLSGGTTGVPKLIPRTHDDYAYNVRACVAASQLTDADVQLIVLPMAHNGALGCPGILGTLASGGIAVLSSDPSPEVALPLIARHRATLTTLVPPLAMIWLEAAQRHEHDLSSLRLVQIGGAKLNSEVARRIRPGFGCALQQWFGMAEGILTHTRLDDPDDVVTQSQGSPLSPADELRVVDADGNDVCRGESGELLVRGPTTFRGYYQSPPPCPNFTQDGFFRTGDVVRVDGAGRLTVEGRIKDVINRGGEKVSAEELENHLLAHPAVRNVAVVSMPDRVLGEKTCAFVVASDECLRLTDVTRHLRERGVAPYKFPDRLELVDALPKTSVGKINKAALRARAAEAYSKRTPNQ